MARTASVIGVRAPRGEKMRPGKGWRLSSPGEKVFKATLIKRFNIGQESVAVFRIVQIPDTPELAEKRSLAGRKAARTRKRRQQTSN